MEEAVARQDGEAAAGAPSPAALDFTNVRGFQVLPVTSPPPDAEAAAPLDEETRRSELVKELAARAARFAEAVDDALVLANDGTIRWLGDPVAKLVAGDETLKPRAVILADDALPAEGREAVQQRVALWIAAHIRKALGPLLALAEPETIPEAVRDIALKLSQSLGILDRERVKAQVKALDQNARGALRKLGVRFGAHYIYVPALLKPAARALCAQLWALPRGEADKEAVAERLLHFASSGRTSFAVELPASGDVFRVAGFRLCGDRAVRVDIVERLTDLIRAALPRHTQADAGAAGEENGAGFVVTNQMTSLTGCSGEHFASILRSLGFASHMVKKSAYLAATRRAAEASAAAAAVATAAATPAAQDEEGGEREAAAQAVAAEGEAPSPAPAEEPAAAEAGVAAQVEPDGEPEAAAQAAPAEEVAPEEPAPTESEPAMESELPSVAEIVEPAPEAAQASPVEEAAPAVEAPAAEDELIEVWRPAPRRPRHAGRDHGRPPRGAQAAAPGESRAPADGQGRKPWRDRGRSNGPGPTQPEGTRPADGGAAHAAQRPAGEGGRDGRRPAWRRDGGKGPRFEEKRNLEAAASGEKSRPRPQAPESRKPSVNLDSPFAKLLDLKPLLKSRDTTK